MAEDSNLLVVEDEYGFVFAAFWFAGRFERTICPRNGVGVSRARKMKPASPSRSEFNMSERREQRF